MIAAESKSTNVARLIPLDRVIADSSTQARAEVSQEAIDELAAAFLAGESIPGIAVFWDGEHYHVGDGHHRVAGARKAGRDKIQAVVYEGGHDAALEYALGANVENRAVRRSRADKRHAVELALAHPTFGQMSNVAVAQLCRVSESLVRSVRSQPRLNEVGDSDTNRGVRIGADGKARRLPQRKSRYTTETFRSAWCDFLNEASRVPQLREGCQGWRELFPVEDLSWPLSEADATAFAFTYQLMRKKLDRLETEEDVFLGDLAEEAERRLFHHWCRVQWQQASDVSRQSLREEMGWILEWAA